MSEGICESTRLPCVCFNGEGGGGATTFMPWITRKVVPRKRDGLNYKNIIIVEFFN